MNSKYLFTLICSLILGNEIIFSSKQINDFSQLNQTTVAGIYYPETVLEIKEILNRATKECKKISIAGKRHSQGGHAFYNDSFVIDINRFNKIINLDTKNKIIRVQTGATWDQIQEYINPHKLALKIMQTTEIFTVGGSLSVNAHGRDPKYGPLIESIRSIKIILASGKIVTASRTKNYELFKLAIGGYGLFGIIIEAEIELTDNEIYRKNADIINVSDYMDFVKNQVIGNPAIGLHYGIICLAPYQYFRKMLAVNYSASSYIPKRAYVLEKERFIAFRRTGFYLRRQSPFVNLCTEFFEWPGIILKEKISHNTSRNNAMRHPAKCLENIPDTKTTDILQSYFIPMQYFTAFMDYLRSCGHNKQLKIVYAFTRYIPENRESFLHYTNDNYFEIVLFINQGKNHKDIQFAKKWTQKVIDKVLSYKGEYYLPCCLYYSKNQLKQGYPQIEKFFAKKRYYDPSELFMNKFYEKYS